MMRRTILAACVGSAVFFAGCGSESQDFETPEPPERLDLRAVEGVEDCAPECTPPPCDLEGAERDGWNTGHADGLAKGVDSVVCAPTECDCGAVGGDYDGNFATCALLPAGTSGDPGACLALCEWPLAGGGHSFVDCSVTVVE